MQNRETKDSGGIAEAIYNARRAAGGLSMDPKRYSDRFAQINSGEIANIIAPMTPRLLGFDYCLVGEPTSARRLAVTWIIGGPLVSRT